jgi:hypothetical protein
MREHLNVNKTPLSVMSEGTLDESELFLNLSSAVCGYTEECEIGRFLVITGASILASMGAAANLLLTYIFMFRSVSNTTPPTLYPTFLAVLDTLLCVFYVLLFGVDVVMNYLKIEVGLNPSSKSQVE